MESQKGHDDSLFQLPVRLPLGSIQSFHSIQVSRHWLGAQVDLPKISPVLRAPP